MPQLRFSAYEQVAALYGQGLSDREIARRSGVSQGTVSRWRKLGRPPAQMTRVAEAARWKPVDGDRYCYLLGAHLGDGTVNHPPGSFRSLQIINDQRYPLISREILDAMQLLFPSSQPRLWPSSVGLSDVLYVADPSLPTAFPQHGPGRQHTRPIVLADWQRELAQAHPGALIRGLIHSDGCRSVNTVRTTLPSGREAKYHYVRYFFTNHSSDIRGIFVEHCELLGVRVTRSNHRNLSVSHRASVAILETIVGPKA